MVVRFEFVVAGDVQISRMIRRFADDVKDLRPPFREIADDFLEIEQRQFESGGQSGSGGWEPVQPRYTATKERAGFGSRTLVRTRALMESLTDAGAPGAVRRIEKLELTMGTRVRSASGFPYPLAHQTGTSRMQARPPIELNEGDKRRWMRFIQRYLVEQSQSRFRAAMQAARRPSLSAAARAVLGGP